MIIEDDIFADFEPDPSRLFAAFDGFPAGDPGRQLVEDRLGGIPVAYIAADRMIEAIVDLKLATTLGNSLSRPRPCTIPCRRRLSTASRFLAAPPRRRNGAAHRRARSARPSRPMSSRAAACSSGPRCLTGSTPPRSPGRRKKSRLLRPAAPPQRLSVARLLALQRGHLRPSRDLRGARLGDGRGAPSAVNSRDTIARTLARPSSTSVVGT